MDQNKRSAARIAGFVASGVGLALWATHIILKYVVNRPVSALLWIALVLILLGFALRRSAAPE